VAEDPRDSNQWLCVEPIESSQALEIMEDFAEQCGNARLAGSLRQALQQRSPSAASSTGWPRIRRSVKHGSTSSTM
jgi:hypothetical protein